MFPPILHRLTAWLCLAVALVSGLAAPAQGYVLCLEPDGCMTLEASVGDDTCNGCEPHRAEGLPGPGVASPGPDAACPCVDISLSSAAKSQRVQPKPTHAPLLKWLVLRSSIFSDLPWTASLARRAQRTDAPRPAGSLLLIRSVVLLV